MPKIVDIGGGDPDSTTYDTQGAQPGSFPLPGVTADPGRAPTDVLIPDQGASDVGAVGAVVYPTIPEAIEQQIPRDWRVYEPLPPEPPIKPPVVYEPPIEPPAVPPISVVLGGWIPVIGGIIGSIWEGWPNELGSGELPGGPGTVFGPIGDPLGTGQQTPLPSDIEQGPVPDTIYGPPGQPQPYVIVEGESQTGPYAVPDPGLAPGVGIGPPVYPQDYFPATSTTTTPAPAPAPAPAAPAPDFGLAPWAWSLIGLGVTAASRRRRGRSQNVTPLTSIEAGLLESAAAIAPGMTSTALIPLGAGGAGFDAGDDDHCNCRKKSGKRRKCLARAQLSWRSGPKKGKAAGTRCIRYAN